MAINKFMLAALRALSYPDLDIKQNYLVDRKIKSLARPSIKAISRMAEFTLETVTVPLECAVFLPPRIESDDVIMYFHGGGWVAGDIYSYTPTCRTLARFSGRTIVSVNYRRAPEHKFPAAVEDCYSAALALLEGKSLLRVDERHLVLAGDSAGGNIAAAVSLMAADRGEFRVRRQVLIYPALANDHGEDSPFESVHVNGTDYLLTSKRVDDYMALYSGDESDYSNPYFAPLLAENLSGQPKTLIITAEYDPLRDEGEAYAERLREAGVEVELHRFPDALHGFFTLPSRFAQVKAAHNIIRAFLDETSYDEKMG
ncbi:MAG: alpha/beta hydrolase [Eubacteriales bacterium]|jgi:acetyl esterase|nr:alpha/beta hydrolase [Clostridiales bacterium]